MARPLLLSAAVLLAISAVSCRPLTGGGATRRLQADAQAPCPDCTPVTVGNKTLWVLEPKSTTDGSWVSLVELKDQIQQFSLAGSGDAGQAGDGAGGAAAALGLSTPQNPFLDPNNPAAPLAAGRGAAALLAANQAGASLPTPSPAAPVVDPNAGTATPTPAAPTTVPEPALPSPSPDPQLLSPAPQPATGGNCPDAQASLDLTNAVRAQWSAAPLVWSADLAMRAQAWASTCAMAHSPGAVGENLMMGPSLTGCAESVQGWANEAPLYPPGGDWTPAAGHFTQLVWKGTSQVGCGMATCASGNFVVCNYNSPGNVVGNFAANVA